MRDFEGRAKREFPKSVLAKAAPPAPPDAPNPHLARFLATGDQLEATQVDVANLSGVIGLFQLQEALAVLSLVEESPDQLAVGIDRAVGVIAIFICSCTVAIHIVQRNIGVGVITIIRGDSPITIIVVGNRRG